MALLMFAVTLFVSAFVLFMVQPIVGKMILPRLGGTPQVWNTCMVFFQAVLLAGYGYTHFSSTRLTVRRQILLHAVLLLIPIIFLIPPIGPLNVRGFAPPPGGNPILPTLVLLATVVGVPFFMVATSAPLLQKWFAYTGDKAAKDPYFLYAASNLGSMLALLAYPFLLEWMLPLNAQAVTWAVLYAVLIVMVLGCGYMVWTTAPIMRLAPLGEAPAPAAPSPTSPPSAEITATPPAPPPSKPAPGADKSTAIKKGPKHPAPAAPVLKDLGPGRETEELTAWRRFRWIMLGAVPSSLMLGVTTHITTDLSPIPLFWLIPLTLYLLSFILVFSRWPVVWTETPHDIMLIAQPIVVACMVFFDMIEHGAVGLFSFPVFFNAMGFFLTAMVCHGELARDRPSTRHLTEFYLLMSVGGVVGGIFNGLLAPSLFINNWEFPLAVIAACLLRPTMKESGWADEYIGGILDEKAAAKGAKKAAKGAPAPREANFHYTMDAVLAGAVLVLTLLLAFPVGRMLFGEPRRDWETGVYFVVFGLPLAIACFFLFRPLRFGGAMAAIILVHAIFYDANFNLGIVYKDRSYFGFIRVRQSAALMPNSAHGLTVPTLPNQRRDGLVEVEFTNLMHGNIDHGKNFMKPKDSKYWGNSDKDFSRLATTYYHQWGPAGRVMQKFNWFKDDLNYYHSDARMPTSLLGLGAAHIGSPLPLAQMVGLWSEPPFATIGLGTGTMASYGRPYQHVHFYEIDNYVRKLSLPLGGGRTFFTYLQDAQRRGSHVQVLMGDARLRMADPYETYDEKKEQLGRGKGGGPDSFYHMMVVDAFSSDSIPIHLLTREAFMMYFQKLAPDGILCVHTSNRYVELVKVVADVADSIEMENPLLMKITDMGEAKDDFVAGQKTKVGDIVKRSAIEGQNAVLVREGKKPIAFESARVKSKLKTRRAHDNAPAYGYSSSSNRPENNFGHYTSEWIMVARDDELLYDSRLAEPAKYMERLNIDLEEKRKRFTAAAEPYWSIVPVENRHVWTDDYSNLFRVLR